MGGLDDATAVVEVERTDGAVGRDGECVQHLALVDVADPATDALVEQCHGGRGVAASELGESSGRGVEVGLGRREVGAEMRRPGPAARRSPHEAHPGCREADGDPVVVGLDDDSGRRSRALPSFATAIQVPAPRHHHVGLEHLTVVEPDEQVLALRLDRLDPRARRDGADQPRRLEAHDRPLDERRAQSAGRSPDGVAFGHRASLAHESAVTDTGRFP